MTLVNVITGRLGAGKTTAIVSLLKGRPAHEKWSVLVNEVGDVGIDGSVFDAPVREIAGGCVCCANGVPFRVAITQLCRSKPDRILVEPSGLGEPSSLLRILRGIGVEVRATICLVPADLTVDWNSDQLLSADVLVVTRTDLSDQNVEAAHNFFPPKVVAVADRGRFDPVLLDTPATADAVLPGDHDHGTTTRVDRGDGSVRFDSRKYGRLMVGWIFDSEWRFDLDKLTFSHGPLDRAKAILQTKLGPYNLHWHQGQLLSAVAIASSHADSRVQFIFSSSASSGQDAYLDDVEAALYEAAGRGTPPLLFSGRLRGL